MSHELPHEVRRAFDALEVAYDAEDLEHGVGRLRVRADARRKRRIAGGVAAAIAVIVVGFALARTPRAEGLLLADGTRCTPRDAGSRLTLVRNDATSVLVRLETGAAHFVVAKQHGRRFDVEAGEVSVQVVGTVFDVERLGETARVLVSEGKVMVTAAGAAPTAVAAGESWSREARLGATAQTAPSSAPAPPAASPSAPASSVGRSTSSSSSSSSSSSAPAHAPSPSSGHGGGVAWRTLARAGDYSGAFAALKTKDSEPPQDSADDLFLAADSARLSGHPAEAVTYLNAIVDRHTHDARADLAAFTLGRIDLDDLNRPLEAARAFATARRLAPHGELAEDALAREVEAWRAAGDNAKARESGRLYLDRYPRGRRADMVQRAMENP